MLKTMKPTITILVMTLLSGCVAFRHIHREPKRCSDDANMRPVNEYMIEDEVLVQEEDKK